VFHKLRLFLSLEKIKNGPFYIHFLKSQQKKKEKTYELKGCVWVDTWHIELYEKKKIG